MSMVPEDMWHGDGTGTDIRCRWCNRGTGGLRMVDGRFEHSSPTVCGETVAAAAFPQLTRKRRRRAVR